MFVVLWDDDASLLMVLHQIPFFFRVFRSYQLSRLKFSSNYIGYSWHASVQV